MARRTDWTISSIVMIALTVLASPALGLVLLSFNPTDSIVAMCLQLATSYACGNAVCNLAQQRRCMTICSQYVVSESVQTGLLAVRFGLSLEAI